MTLHLYDRSFGNSLNESFISDTLGNPTFISTFVKA